jgi:adenylate cyclase
VPWDDRISRRHAEMRWDDGRLRVAKLQAATNPVFYRGRAHLRCAVLPGEHFVIGNTSFYLVEHRVDVTHDAPPPVTQQAFSRHALEQARYRDAEGRIDMLSRLPEIISGAAGDRELAERLVNLLLHGISQAHFVALVRHEPASGESGEVDVLHWDSRTPGDTHFSSSARLIHAALEKGESLVHIWRGAASPPSAQYTQWDDMDWAFCTPIGDESSPGWAIYAAGRGGLGSSPSVHDPMDLQDDLKFAELAAHTVARVRRLRRLERRQASLSQFISPVVLDRLGDHDPDEVLAPREADVSVLFCDLRGFSRRSERSADDLMGLLERVSRALGVMTHEILEQGGVVGDFHGDAAMGFWGWPLPQQDAEVRACRAALAIRAAFAAASRQEQHPLADFRLGIGIATGCAVAGKIGTVDQVKITVFGPVVNLAARLEGLTKLLRAPILLDETTARRIAGRVDPGKARLRRVARVRPYGLDTPLEVSELLPPAADYPQLSDEHIVAYEAALDALLSRDWSQAFSLLHRVPADDRVKDFLTVYIAQHNRTPPDDWDGVISVEEKW